MVTTYKLNTKDLESTFIDSVGTATPTKLLKYKFGKRMKPNTCSLLPQTVTVWKKLFVKRKRGNLLPVKRSNRLCKRRNSDKFFRIRVFRISAMGTRRQENL